MPLIIVNRSSEVEDHVYIRLKNNLQKIVADALTCENPDGNLTGADIELWSRKKDYFDDLGFESLQIIVFANDYPERRINLEERREKIQKRIKALLPSHLTGWVWILLAEGSFGKL